MTRRYNNENAGDHVTWKWMKEQARKAGMTFGQWCTESGIMSEWVEKKANREIPASVIGPRAMEVINNRVSLQEFQDGGDQVASILVDRRSRNKVKPPKRKVGRPRKYFKQVGDPGWGPAEDE